MRTLLWDVVEVVFPRMVKTRMAEMGMSVDALSSVADNLADDSMSVTMLITHEHLGLRWCGLIPLREISLAELKRNGYSPLLQGFASKAADDIIIALVQQAMLKNRR